MTSAVDKEDQHLLAEDSAPQSQPTITRIDNEEELEEEEETLEDYASMVVTILQPVALTMLLVIYAVRRIQLPQEVQQAGYAMYMPFQESESDSTAYKFFGSVLNALGFLVVIVVITVVFVLLYKYRCLKIIYAWLFISTGMLLVLFGGLFFELLLTSYNLALDWITFSALMWNFGVVGIVSIFWIAPPKVTQGYLIIISALMAIYFTRFPEWTTFAILAVVAIYDLFAVLCPRGPLKVLVETAQQRKEPIPALLYNASVFIMMARNPLREADEATEEITIEQNDEQQPVLQDAESNINNNNSNSTKDAPSERQESKGVKLGLGDFVFYSVLIGRAALYDMLTVFTCFIGIITGLFMTLLLLAIFKKALPALPISIFIGLFFYFLTNATLLPFVIATGQAQIFI